MSLLIVPALVIIYALAWACARAAALGDAILREQLEAMRQRWTWDIDQDLEGLHWRWPR